VIRPDHRHDFALARRRRTSRPCARQDLARTISIMPRPHPSPCRCRVSPFIMATLSPIPFRAAIASRADGFGRSENPIKPDHALLLSHENDRLPFAREPRRISSFRLPIGSPSPSRKRRLPRRQGIPFRKAFAPRPETAANPSTGSDGAQPVLPLPGRPGRGDVRRRPPGRGRPAGPLPEITPAAATMSVTSALPREGAGLVEHDCGKPVGILQALPL